MSGRIVIPYHPRPLQQAVHDGRKRMRVLNRVAQAQLVGAEKQADPPLLAADDSVVGRIRSGAGGITYVRPDALQQGRGLMQLPVDFRLDVAEAVLEKRRGAVRGAFLNDRIQMAGGPQMTATEVMARERKQNLVLGPVLGRLESEFLGPLTDRVFMISAGAVRIDDLGVVRINALNKKAA